MTAAWSFSMSYHVVALMNDTPTRGERMKYKELIILTGPPGSGKLEYAAEHYPSATVYEASIGNKPMWRDQRDGTAVFITAAPSESAKRYWADEAKRFGFEPTVIVLSGVRSREVKRLVAREGEGLSERQRARVAKRVSRWYTSYEPYEHEIKINARNQSVPKTRYGRAAATGRLPAYANNAGDRE